MHKGGELGKRGNRGEAGIKLIKDKINRDAVQLAKSKRGMVANVGHCYSRAVHWKRRKQKKEENIGGCPL